MERHNLRSYIIVFVLCFCSVDFGRAQDFFYTTLPNQQLLPTCNTIATLRDKEGYMWYGTRRGGLCRDDGYRIDVFQGLKELSVYCLEESANGDIWVATYKGVYIVHKADYSLEHFDPKNIPEEKVANILCDKKGNMWVAMGSGEILVYGKDGNLQQKIQTRHLLSSVFEDSRGQKWLTCGDNALLQYDAKRKTFVECPWSASSYPRSITEDKQNHCFWIATWGDGVVKYDTKTGQCTQEEATMNADENSMMVFNTVVDEKHGQLWVSTMSNLELYKIQDGRLSRNEFSIEHGAEQMVIDATYMDTDGNLWVPGHSPHTFILLNNDENVHRNTLTGIRKAQGFMPMVDRYVRDGDYAWIWQSRKGWSHYNLHTDEMQYVKEAPEDVKSVLDHPVETLTDRKGHRWMMTDQRIVELSAEQSHGAGATPVLFGNQRVYLNSDPQLQMGCFLSLQMDGDSIVVGGLDAMCTLGSTAELDKPSHTWTATPRIASLTIDGENMLMGSSTKQLDINSDTKSVMLNLTSCDILNARHITFAYKIKGLTDEWTVLPMGKSAIELIGLKKGKYIIMLRCTDKYGCWGNEVDAFHLHRLPAWWESGWAYTLYIIIMLALAALIVWYVRIVQRRQQEFQNMLTLMRMYNENENENGNEIDDEDEEDVRTLTGDQQRLLNKAMQCVKNNLSNTEYGIEEFAKDMFMSRMTLYRNLHLITGQTPMDFIRTIRLEESARLITASSITLAEVSDRCGFSSPSYFSKCFKKKYGVLPKHFGKCVS